jgi:hypothetical protein
MLVRHAEEIAETDIRRAHTLGSAVTAGKDVAKDELGRLIV